MDVLPPGEGLTQKGVSRKVRQEPQLNLGVICRQKTSSLRGHEATPHQKAQLRSGRNVLQVGAGRGKTARRGHGLVELSMQAPVGSPSLFHGKKIGREELSKLPEGKDQLRKRVKGGQPFQRLFVGRRSTAALSRATRGRKSQASIKNFSHLLGGKDGKCLPGLPVDFGFQTRNLFLDRFFGLEDPC